MVVLRSAVLTTRKERPAPARLCPQHRHADRPAIIAPEDVQSLARLELRLSRSPVPRGRRVTVSPMACRRPASARSFRPSHDVDEQDQLPAGEAHQNTAPQSHLPLLIFFHPVNGCHRRSVSYSVDAAPPGQPKELMKRTRSLFGSARRRCCDFARAHEIANVFLQELVVAVQLVVLLLDSLDAVEYHE